MHIQPIQNSVMKQNDKPNFKAAYPVVHWVAEANSSYAPAISFELNKKLHRILVSLFNKTSNLSKTTHGLELIKKLSEGDKDYRTNSYVRSYYNKGGGWEDRFIPVSYLITGEDSKRFSERFGKPLGVAIVSAPKKKGEPISAELNAAIHEYAFNARKFVQDSKKRIFDENGIEQTLHTKFQTIRTKTGRVTGYRLVDIKFCPVKGPDNPFVRTGLVNIKK